MAISGKGMSSQLSCCFAPSSGDREVFPAQCLLPFLSTEQSSLFEHYISKRPEYFLHKMSLKTVEFSSSVSALGGKQGSKAGVRERNTNGQIKIHAPPSILASWNRKMGRDNDAKG